jgi:anti-sigma regulatory factor (Ser/Thr protein kinase)
LEQTANGWEQERAPAGETGVQLPREPRSADLARRFVDRQLRDRGLPEQVVERALLVSSELVTNAFKHGEGKIELRLQMLADRVRVEVIDEGHCQAPAVREQQGGETGGWGLKIVERVAAGTAPFVNTGRDPIASYDYLFDDGSGKVGFKPA